MVQAGFTSAVLHMSFAIKHRNTDIDNADVITRETLLTTMQTDSLWLVVLFSLYAHVRSL